MIFVWWKRVGLCAMVTWVFDAKSCMGSMAGAIAGGGLEMEATDSFI
jgi:hypothetical protein